MGFGLIHGLGLATRFQAIRVPKDGRVVRLMAFNTAIELGQIIAVNVMGLLLILAKRLVADSSWQPAERDASALRLVTGGITAGALSTQAALPADRNLSETAASVAAAGGAGTGRTWTQCPRPPPATRPQPVN